MNDWCAFVGLALVCALGCGSPTAAQSQVATPNGGSAPSSPTPATTEGQTRPAGVEASQTPPAPEPPAAVPTRSIVLTTYFEALLRDGTRRPLASGDKLRSGDRFSITLGLREPLYLYIIYADSRGEASVLYPQHGDEQRSSTEAFRFPEGQDFELDDVPGKEHLVVVASRQPLSKTDSDLAALVARVRSTHEWSPQGGPAPDSETSPEVPSKKQRALPPQSSSSNQVAQGPVPILEGGIAGGDARGPNRGVHLVDSASKRIESSPDAAGLVAIPLVIDHVR